ncbi:MAG: nucleotidyltransferase [Clostridium sp.]|uniref:nucleotidyltransferase n=1 Tax=Clostridium sp. TaxID=1506 RepID=UPI0025B7D508|nr:nucleotidyltransferase [Clostridium sp.]MCH3964023.1 nucleotidyltransferase [Clostridium sp.]MCI1716224.1 nucleotidyltransferase [Clostridium sp.]MCI1800536.1 nucleotidyltransferase [Clostridium sp.]MCI1814401.1 nucleotidyltransferase [Clostridium sp.]MCI1871300.1 nucleotidyltransferase [Clostridium sp.]
MSITGIIAEYNPFHNGHIYHIKNASRLANCHGIIAVISGDFVQRGTPSIIDKWNKTRIALLNGIDLVIELPVLYSISSAEFFAHGATSLLNSLGVVDNICFGSECTDIQILDLISQILVDEPPELKANIKNELMTGKSYAEARSNSLITLIRKKYKYTLSDDLKSILSSPNNILAIEYIKSLKKLHSSMRVFPIERIGESYCSSKITENFPSSSAIREFLKSGNDISTIRRNLPDDTYNLVSRFRSQNYNFSMEDSIVPYLKYKCFFSKNNMNNLPDVSEGLENRIFRAIENNSSYNDIILSSKSKRYAYTRISRILCQFFLGFEKFDTKALREKDCPYARVLGFNRKGMEILKKAKHTSSIPIYTKFPKKLDEILTLDLLATKAYSLLNRYVDFNSDYKKGPVIFKN